MMITDDYNVASPILEAYSYYPFGKHQKGIGPTQAGSLHNFKNTFQKQELNEDLGVDLYEFKYRMDDPQISRFWQIDPLADKYEYKSSYALGKNHVSSHLGWIKYPLKKYLKVQNWLLVIFCSQKYMKMVPW